jgi:hypothetical protein
VRVKGFAWFAFGVLVAAAAAVVAQPGGYPSRIIAQTVLVRSVGTATAAPVKSESTTPLMEWAESDAAADNRRWRAYASSEAFRFDAVTDSGGVSGTYLEVQRTGSTVDSVNLLATQLLGNSVDMTPASGTFTVSWNDACSTTPTTTFDYQKVGNIVVLKAVSSAGFPCTSDSTSFLGTAADVPAAIRPSGAFASSAQLAGDNGNIMNNGGNVRVRLTINTTGNVVLNNCNAENCSTAWTNSGNKAFSYIGDMVYMLGNP